MEARKNPIGFTLLPGKSSTFLSSADYFQNQLFSKNSLRNLISVSNSLDSVQARCSVRPDLGPNFLQKLSEIKS